MMSSADTYESLKIFDLVPLTCVVIEHNKTDALHLKELLEQYAKGIKVLGVANTVQKAEILIKITKPQLIFSELIIGEFHFNDWSDQIPDLYSRVVFTTHHEKIAKTNKFNNSYSLNKPVHKKELLDLINNLKKDIVDCFENFKPQAELLRKHTNHSKNTHYTSSPGKEKEANLSLFHQDKDSFLIVFNAFIEDHLDQTDININTIAEKLFCSQFQLNELVKKHTQMTTVKYIQEIRLKKAYDYLKTGNYKFINDVIYKVGYNSRSHFYKIFEERFGIKPNKVK